MRMKKSTLLLLATAAMVSLVLAASARADIIAATDFDGRTLTTVNQANDTATNLNWTTNGVEDPGDMTAVEENGAVFPGLFDGNSLTQNMFAPAINVGNLNTGWKTTVALTVSPGYIVTVTDVTFDYWAISGGQAHNVPRNSDFTVTLFDPANVAIGSDFIDNARSGTTATPPVPTLTANLGAIALSEPGTYTVEIWAREAPETGNHIGIDNLSINGTVVIPEPAALALLGLGGLTLLRRRRV